MPPFTLAGLIGSFLDLLTAYPALFALLLAVLLVVAAKLLFLAVGHLRFVIRRRGFRREIDAICRETEREWQRVQRSSHIHRVARSIVHPDDPKAAA